MMICVSYPRKCYEKYLKSLPIVLYGLTWLILFSLGRPYIGQGMYDVAGGFPRVNQNEASSRALRSMCQRNCVVSTFVLILLNFTRPKWFLISLKVKLAITWHYKRWSVTTNVLNVKKGGECSVTGYPIQCHLLLAEISWRCCWYERLLSVSMLGPTFLLFYRRVSALREQPTQSFRTPWLLYHVFVSFIQHFMKGYQLQLHCNVCGLNHAIHYRYHSSVATLTFCCWA